MKKLFRVEEHRILMVYAEDIEEAQFLFTENIHLSDQPDTEIMAMEADIVPISWLDAIPYGEGEDDRTCSEIMEKL